MEANNNWAPPTIGDIRLPDRDLGRRLSRQASVEMRAKMIGLDWTTLRASRSRLLLGAWLITGLASLVAIAINGTVPVGGVLGVTIVVVAIAAAASMLSLRSVSHLPVLIARNDPSLAARYTSLARLAPSQSLLGYRVRWILLRHAITTICSIAIVALMARGF
jgi:apolipoprotein N-acyltransferase